MTRKRMDAVEILGDGLFIANSRVIATFAEKQKLPSVGFKESSEAGGLLGFGVNFNEQFRRAVYFVYKILKGAKPSDIPVERPTRFEMVVNMKTAKALGITFPPVVMLRADKVIE